MTSDYQAFDADVAQRQSAVPPGWRRWFEPIRPLHDRLNLRNGRLVSYKFLVTGVTILPLIVFEPRPEQFINQFLISPLAQSGRILVSLAEFASRSRIYSLIRA